MKDRNKFINEHPSDKASKMIFNFHSDPGHGWLAVKKNLLRELNLAGSISNFSYMKGHTAYLEEDRDLSIFFKAFKEKFGFEPKIKELKQVNWGSRIRGLDRFSMETN